LESLKDLPALDNIDQLQEGELSLFPADQDKTE